MSKNMIKGSLLATTMIAGMAFAVPAYAQEEPTPTNVQGTEDVATPSDETPAAGVQSNESAGPAEPTSAKEIVVTGTLIRNPNLVASAPVQVVGQEEIQLQQANVAEEVLSNIPGVVPNVGSNVNNGNGGSSFVDLRGLGAKRNLVLLDGVRIVPSGLLGAVDLNNIPLALIDRVDALTGGASSTYGADAVSGVVNFITRSDFAGMELSVGDAITQRGDGNYVRADLTLGANFDDGRGNAVISVGYQEADPVYQGGDRPDSQKAIESYFGACGAPCEGSPTSTPSTLEGLAGGAVQIAPDGLSVVAPYAAFNFAPFNLFQTPFKRYNLYSAGHYDVADNITVYARGLYSDNSVSTIVAPSGVFNSTVTVNVSNPFLAPAVRNYICANADFDPNTAGRQTLTQAECDAAAVATDPTDPDYRQARFGLRRRTVEVGPRASTYNTKVWDFRAGVRGDITDSIGFDLFGARGQSENIQSASGYTITSRARQALLTTVDGSGNVVCQDPSNGCVPLNAFGPAGSISPEAAAFINGEATITTKTALSQARGTINGDLGFSSPWAAEPIGFAVGAEYRKYKALQFGDPNARSGQLGGFGGAVPTTDGGFDVYEGFAEVIAPIVADKPGFNELTLEAGIRRSAYRVNAPGDPEFKTTTWKIAGSWEPISDIKIRGNYQKAVRAPNIGELFAPLNSVLTNLGTDPCAGAAPLNNANLAAICIAQGADPALLGSIQNPAAGQANVTTGGNPFALPETARTWTIGAVLRPSFLPGFNATIDYYHIKITDALSFATPQDLIQACFGDTPTAPPANATNPACTLIRRNPSSGGLDGDPTETPGLFSPLSNLGTLLTDGVDLTANYKTNLGEVAGAPAKLNLSFSGNWTNRALFQATPTSLNRECVGYYSVNCLSIQPKYQFNQRTTLSLGRVDLSLLWRYIHKSTLEPEQVAADNAAAEAANRDEDGVLLPADEQGCPDYNGADPNGCVIDPAFRTIKAYHYFDFSTRFNVNEHFDFTFTISNLFDKDPPVVGNSIGSTTYNSGNTYPATYDALGRRFAAGARIKF